MSGGNIAGWVVFTIITKRISTIAPSCLLNVMSLSVAHVTHVGSSSPPFAPDGFLTREKAKSEVARSTLSNRPFHQRSSFLLNPTSYHSPLPLLLTISPSRRLAVSSPRCLTVSTFYRFSLKCTWSHEMASSHGWPKPPTQPARCLGYS
ncbi:unnamed protein product [Protopolystoma xenopodis]|uniref:Uncharacterized protein n=1 Tax=Protopolystoma xenopodis TaxID=117903 RepID=A0A3S5C833_9PLAT|nr:unnamed protein product [Protopolystoma xenopodis]